MARIKIAGTTGASENTIVFSKAGGHSHNGRNSSLIDSTAYSVYDFSPTFVGTEVNPDRAIRQENNRIAFEDLIKRVVNNSVLAPAGIRLEPGSLNGSLIIANTITANQLAANTITANELSSNIVLINNVIRSSNYNGIIAANGAITTGGNTGWAITSFGSAEFANVSIRGSVVATNLTASTAGTIGGWQIGSTALTAGPLTLSSSGYLQISTSDASETYTIDLSSGGLTTLRFRDNQYAQFQILSTQTRSDSFFTGYSTSLTNLKNTVIQTASSISLQTKPTSPSHTLSETVVLTTGESFANQANGRIGVYSKNLSGSILRQINLDNGIVNSYSYQGNANVAGTGNASYHPSGIYSTGTNWLYGTLYLNNNPISGAASITALGEITKSDGTRTRMRINDDSLLFWNAGGAQKSEYSATGFYTDTGYVAGVFTAGTKFFRIQHPMYDEKMLVHSSLEGPTTDVFYRGESQLIDGIAEIELPNYFEHLTMEDNRTIIVTPIISEDNIHCCTMACTRISDGGFKVIKTDDSDVYNQKFSWLVIATRKNSFFDVEPSKNARELGN
jgi:hypothetical protein